MTTQILPHTPENTRIEIILGCMYSGKSTELLRRTKRYQAIGKNVLLINHTYDTRTGNSVKTHRDETENALKITNLMDIFTTVNQNTAILRANVIGIDEAQFSGDLREFVLAMEQYGKTLIIFIQSNNVLLNMPHFRLKNMENTRYRFLQEVMLQIYQILFY